MNFRQEYSLNYIHPSTPIHWLGFTTITHDLVRSGWELRAEYRHDTMMQYIIMRHPQHRIHGRSSEGYTYFQWHERFMNGGGLRGARGDLGAIRMEIAGDIHVHSMSATQMPVTSEINDLHVATINPVTQEITPVSSFFNTEKEIIVPQSEDVMTLLSRIQEMQAPKARELLAKERERGELQQFKEQATILTFKGAS